MEECRIKASLKKRLLIAVIVAVLVAVDVAVMYTEREVEITEKQEVPIEFQPYAPDLPGGTDVEQTFVSAGEPVYGVTGERFSMSTGSVKLKGANYGYYIFIPCTTASGEQVWIGDITYIHVTGGSQLMSSDKSRVMDERKAFRALIPEDGSEFTLRGYIASLDEGAQIEPDQSYYAPLSATGMSSEKYDAVAASLADATASRRFFQVFTDGRTTRTVDVVVGHKKKRELSKVFKGLVLAEIVAAVVLYKLSKKKSPAKR